MIELGKYQTLEVVKKTDFGFYLSETGSDGKHRILLPMKEAPEGTKQGDRLQVFIYKDSEDREIATTVNVPLTVGELAVLKVKEVSKIGAFLDWGLMKDLLLPYKEQTIKVEEGDQVLVALYIDKSSRLCATMKVYDSLSTNSDYKKDDMVTGIVYEQIDNFGSFVAVDYKYSALIPKNEIFHPIKIGEIVTARVINVREDGKLTLSLRAKSYVQMDSDSSMILEKLKTAGGFLPYHDRSDSDEIKEVFHISKNAFKRAVGRLYKAGTITITDDGIRLSE
ncbi:S1 RNA-binding domain-containing protein [Mobilitalea sibirica]|uniref:S1 RNA-binding domain-containing protein n=1 Tax=Mobilitalea sibirica TaxID=1462919 RepID=A0A8J7HCU9_9FIRM|nr:S1-like domain-containing RNA-binding protein [Mobilitalea sibirica]MBH1942446.1 S1 RNA-binding domain-containing protein [Mobilitalea sibirica]